MLLYSIDMAVTDYFPQFASWFEQGTNGHTTIPRVNKVWRQSYIIIYEGHEDSYLTRCQCRGDSAGLQRSLSLPRYSSWAISHFGGAHQGRIFLITLGGWDIVGSIWIRLSSVIRIRPPLDTVPTTQFFSLTSHYRQTSNISRILIPKLKCFSFRLAVVFGQSTKVMC